MCDFSLVITRPWESDMTADHYDPPPPLSSFLHPSPGGGGAGQPLIVCVDFGSMYELGYPVDWGVLVATITMVLFHKGLRGIILHIPPHITLTSISHTITKLSPTQQTEVMSDGIRR